MDQAVADPKSVDRPPLNDVSLDFAIEVVQRGEALGFDATLIGKVHVDPDLEAWMLAVALAARTTSIELIVAVHPGLLAPQLAANMGASLDRLSNGRFAMNVINGWWDRKSHNFSSGHRLDTSDARYRRVGEFLEIAHRLWAGGLWAGENFIYDREFLALDEGCEPTRPVDGIPPIYTASRSESGLEKVPRRAVVCHI